MASYQLDDRGVITPCPQCGQKNRVTYLRLGSPTRCRVCKAAIPPLAAPVEVPNILLFDALIQDSVLPVVVDYWAPWCGPCKMVAPELVKVAAQSAGRLVVAKVDTEAVPEVIGRYNIQAIPTMAVFRRGHEQARTSGARPARDILAFVNQALAD
jgi:thioredoxin 2